MSFDGRNVSAKSDKDNFVRELLQHVRTYSVSVIGS